MIFPLYYFN